MKFALQVANGDYKRWVKELTELGLSVSKKREIISEDYDHMLYYIEVPDLQSLLEILDKEDMIITKSNLYGYDIPMITIYNACIE